MQARYYVSYAGSLLVIIAANQVVMIKIEYSAFKYQMHSIF
jgi:hypothetical protein